MTFSCFWYLSYLSLIALCVSPTPSPTGIPTDTPTQSPTNTPSKLKVLEGGGYCQCALFEDGRIKCWGDNEHGILGIGLDFIIGDETSELGDGMPIVDLFPGYSAVDIQGSFSTICARMNDSKLVCWGKNSRGELGIGDKIDRGVLPSHVGIAETIDLGVGVTVSKFALGNYHVCAVLNTSDLKCWGGGGSGQIGKQGGGDRGGRTGEMGDNLPTVNVGTGRSVREICAGDNYNCMVLDDFSVKCFGGGAQGRSGYEDTATRGRNGDMGDNLPTVSLGTSFTAATIMCGQRHNCVISDLGFLKCWGFGYAGKLGQGNTTNIGESVNTMGDSLPTVDLGTGNTAAGGCAGFHHTCVILNSGNVKCWGRNRYGELNTAITGFIGDAPGEMGDNLPTVNLGAGRTATEITCSEEITCVRLDNSALKCFGGNAYGRLGTGDRIDSTTTTGDDLPTIDIGTGHTSVSVTATEKTTCTVLNTGKIKCWGYSDYGELFSGNPSAIGIYPSWLGDNLPYVNFGYELIANYASVGRHHVCVLLSTGNLKCWGGNLYGQLGYGDTRNRGKSATDMGDSLPTVDLGAGRTVVKVSSSYFHTCAVFSDLTAKCWGLNDFGQLGLEDSLNRGTTELGDFLPTINVGPSASITSICTGEKFTCALLIGGNVKCWGENSDGQLGQEDTANRGGVSSSMGDSLPTVNFDGSALELHCGKQHACVLLKRNKGYDVKCWGEFPANGGETGGDIGTASGQMGSNLTTLDFGTGKYVTSLYVIDDRSCVTLNGEVAKCWGESGNVGKLGLNSTTDYGGNSGTMGDNLPTINIGNNLPIRSFSGGIEHTCALFNWAGQVKCWAGGSRSDQHAALGSGTRNWRLGGSSDDLGDNVAFTKLGQDVVGLYDMPTASPTSAPSDAPTSSPIFPPEKLDFIAAGDSHTCGVFLNGRVKCFGSNFKGKLGIGQQNIIGDVPGEMGSNIPIIDLGTDYIATTVKGRTGFMCVLLSSGEMKCWGRNRDYVLGIGGAFPGNKGLFPDQMGDNLPTVNLGVGRTATDFFIGYDTWWCALRDDGEKKCHGKVSSHGKASISLQQGQTYVDMCGGYRWGCYLLNIGEIHCVGKNSEGQLGTWNKTIQPAVDLGSGFTTETLSCGYNFACAKSDLGHVKCWGEGARYVLGTGSSSSIGKLRYDMGDNLTSVDLGAGRTASHVLTSYYSVCVILDDGNVRCWGDNTYGQFGIGNTLSSGKNTGDNLPLTQLGTGKTAVSGSLGGVLCLILNDNTLKCFGSNMHGALGDGTTIDAGGSIESIGDNRSVVDLGTYYPTSVGVHENTAVCVVLNTGKLSCWGLIGTKGLLGISQVSHRGNIASLMGSALPFVDFGNFVTQLHIGVEHTCAILSSGEVKCFGGNGYGQLGLEDMENRGERIDSMGDHLPTVSLGTGRTASGLCVGGFHTCLILDTNDTKCFGRNNNGQIGRGASGNLGKSVGEMGDNLPTVDWGAGRFAVHIACGMLHTCGVMDDNSIKCFGYNRQGQLGINSQDSIGLLGSEMGSNLVAVKLNTTDKVVSVGCGHYHTCGTFQLSGGDLQVKCWGEGRYGKLGTGSNSNIGNDRGEVESLSYIDLGSSPVFKLYVGSQHNCVILVGGHTKCFGRNDMGQVGLEVTDIGIGNVVGEMGDNLTTVDFGTGVTTREIALGTDFSCALLNWFGVVKCFGGIYDYVLGKGYSVTEIGNSLGEMGDALAVTDLGQEIDTSYPTEAPTSFPTFTPTSVPSDTPSLNPTNLPTSLIPIQKTSAMFSSANAYSFIVFFTLPTDCLNQKWTFCEPKSLFNPATFDLLGDPTTVTCQWRSSLCMEVLVELGRNAVLQEKDRLNFANSTLPSTRVLFPEILPPLIPDIDSVDLLSICDTLRVGLGKTQGLGGRPPLALSWAITSPSSTFNYSSTELSFSINADLIRPGTQLKVELNITNWQGTRASAYRIITKAETPSPHVALEGPATWLKSSGNITFRSLVTLPATRCDPNQTSNFSPEKWKLYYLWSATDAQLCELVFSNETKTSFSPQKLSLLTDYSLHLTVSVFEGTETLFVITRSTSFSIEPSELIVSFVQGYETSVYRLEDVIIDSSPTIDYDNLPLRRYQWNITCLEAITRCEQELNRSALLLTDKILTIPEKTFSDAVDLEIKLTLNTTDLVVNKTATVAMHLKVLNVPATLVTTLGLKYATLRQYESLSRALYVYNRAMKVRLSSSYVYKGNESVEIRAVWKCRVHGEEDFVLLSNDTLLSDSIYSENLVLNGNSPMFSNEVVWECLRQVDVSHSLYNTSTISSVFFVINSPPRLGTILLNIINGTELKDDVTATAEFWEDEDRPLMYSFSLDQWTDSVDFHSPTRSVITSKSFNNKATFRLTAGLWRVLLTVEDTIGAFTLYASDRPIYIIRSVHNITQLVPCNASNILSSRLADMKVLAYDQQILFLVQQLAQVLGSSANYSDELISSLINCNTEALNTSEIVPLIIRQLMTEVLLISTKAEDLSGVDQLIAALFSLSSQTTASDTGLVLEILENLLRLLWNVILSNTNEWGQQSRDYWYDVLFEVVAKLIQTTASQESCVVVEDIIGVLEKIFGVALANSIVDEGANGLNSTNMTAYMKKAGNSSDTTVTGENFYFSFPKNGVNGSDSTELYIVQMPRFLYECLYGLEPAESLSTFAVNCDSVESSIYGYTYDITLHGREGEISVQELEDSVVIKHENIPNDLVDHIECKWHDKKSNTWKTTGCVKTTEKMSTKVSTVTCSCSHLTEFALIYTQKQPESCSGVHPLSAIEGLYNIPAVVFYFLFGMLSAVLVENAKRDPSLIEQKIRRYVYVFMFLYSFVSCVRYLLLTISVTRRIPLLVQALLAVLNNTLLYFIQAVIIASWSVLSDVKISGAKTPMIDKIRTPFVVLNTGLVAVDVTLFVLLAVIEDSDKFERIFFVGSIVLAVISITLSLLFFWEGSLLSKKLIDVFVSIEPKKKTNASKMETKNKLKMAVARRILRTGNSFSAILLILAILNVIPLAMGESVFGGDGKLLLVLHIVNFVMKACAMLLVLNLYKPRYIYLFEKYFKKDKREQQHARVRAARGTKKTKSTGKKTFTSQAKSRTEVRSTTG